MGIAETEIPTTTEGIKLYIEEARKRIDYLKQFVSSRRRS